MSLRFRICIKILNHQDCNKLQLHKLPPSKLHPTPLTGWTNWPLNDVYISKLIWWQFLLCQCINVYPLTIKNTIIYSDLIGHQELQGKENNYHVREIEIIYLFNGPLFSFNSICFNNDYLSYYQNRIGISLQLFGKSKHYLILNSHSNGYLLHCIIDRFPCMDFE